MFKKKQKKYKKQKRFDIKIVLYIYILIFLIFLYKYKKKEKKGTSIGQFTRLLRSLELRAVSQRTMLLLRDQKLLFRMRDCFEGSIIHLPTLWLDAVDACMTCLQVKFLASLLSNTNIPKNKSKTRTYCLSCCKS